MKLPKVGVIILNYNGLKDTRACLKSISKTTYKNFQVIVADNGSKKDEAKILSSEFSDKKINFIRFKKNWGFAEGNNKIARKLRTKYIVFLNNDTRVAPSWLNELVAEAEKDKKIAVVQSKILSLNKPQYFEYAGAAGGLLDKLGYPYARGRIGFHLEKDVGQYDDAKDIFWASGTCMMVKRKIFDKLGGFDKDFFAYQEEIDFCWRVKRSNLRVIYAPASVIHHLGMGTAFRLLAEKTFWVHRNNLRLILKNMSVGNLLWVLPIRIILDWASALFYLFTGRFMYLTSVLKAHLAIFAGFAQIIRKRKKFSRLSFVDNSLQPVSIYWDYFIKGKRRYSEIVGKDTKNTPLLYYEDLVQVRKLAAGKGKFDFMSKLLKNHKNFLLILIVFIAILLRIPSLSMPLDRDEGTYAYIGWAWLEKGVVPYRDVFDHKPPLTYLVYGILSTIGGNNLITIRFGALLYFLATIAIFYYFVRRRWDEWTAAVLSLVLLWLISSPDVEGWGFNTEALFMPWVILAFGFTRSSISARIINLRKWFFIGLFGGIAGLFKQVAYIPIFGLFLIVVFYDIQLKRTSLNKWTAFIFGILLPAMLAGLYFYSKGELKDLFAANSAFNSAYLKEGLLPNGVQKLTNSSGLFFPYIKWLFYIKFNQVLIALGIFLTSLYLYFKHKNWIDIVFSAILVSGLLVSAKLAGVREIGHYYIPVIWGTIFASGGISLIKPRITKTIILIVCLVLVVTKIINYSFLPGTELSKSRFGTQEVWFSDSEKVGKFIRNQVPSDKILYVWANEPQIYFYAQRQAPSYFLHFYVLNNYPNGWEIWRDELYSMFPNYIVTYEAKDEPMYSKLVDFLKIVGYNDKEMIGSFRVLEKQ